MRIVSIISQIALLGGISLVLAGPVRPVGQIGSIDWCRRVVTATGIGVPTPDQPQAAARPQAMRAAQLTALRNALEIIKGVPITSSTTVEKRMVGNDVIATRIDGFLQGFEQKGKTKYMSDGTVEITVEVPIDGELARALLSTEITDTPQTSQDRKNAKKKPSFTGIIIDCSGLSVNPAMMPTIYDEAGGVIYGPAQIVRKNAVKWGVVRYVTSLDSANAAVDRIGKKPLRIKASAAVGEQKSDVTIPDSEANAIRKNPGNSQILEQCKVIFVIEP